MTAFCFCGSLSNSIETLEVKSGVKWKLLPFDERVMKDNSSAGVLFQNSILVFGGVGPKRGEMQRFSEKGELEQCLSHYPLIPKAMREGVYAVQNKKIYAVGRD